MTFLAPPCIYTVTLFFLMSPYRRQHFGFYVLVLRILHVNIIAGHRNLGIFRLSRKIFVLFVGYVPIITCREDVTCSECVTTDVTCARMRQYVA